MAEPVTVGPERYAPPPYRPRATLGDHVARLAPQLRSTPARAAAATAVAALAIVCAVALQPVETTAVDDIGAFKAECGMSMYVFGHPSAGVEQTCRDVYAGHAIAFFVSAGALVVAIAALVVLLTRPAAAPSEPSPRRWRAYVSTPGRASAITLMVLFVFLALGSLLPAHAQGDSPRGAFSAQCGLSIFLFGHDDAAVQHACSSAYGTRGRTFLASIALITIGGVAVGASVHNERRRAQAHAP